MKDIDFLPLRYRDARAQRRAQCWRIAVLLMFGGLVCSAVVGQYGIRRRIQEQAEVVRAQHAAALAEASRLARLEQELKPHRVRAELLTQLRQPWPATQVLSQVLAPLPDSITLSKLEICRQPAAGASPREPGPISEAPAAAAAAGLLPAERDVQRLRKELNRSQVVVTLEGLTEDEASLHVYLGQLAAADLLDKAELASLAAERPDASAVGARFQVRLVVRPGYGQQGGPATPPPQHQAHSQSPQTRTRPSP